MKSAIIFGSIGAITEISELERQAYNLAFAANGLDWQWSPDAFRDIMRTLSGVDRIAAAAEQNDDIVNPAVIESSKTAYLSRLIEEEGILVRPGVREIIHAARQDDVKVAWATTTDQQTLESVLSGLFPGVLRSQFDWISDASMVKAVKPAPDVYIEALAALCVDAEQAVAIEDSPEAASAARGAGINTIACPNTLCEGRSFPPGVQVVGDLSEGFSLRNAKVA